MDNLFETSPNKKIDTEKVFGLKCKFEVLGFEKKK